MKSETIPAVVCSRETQQALNGLNHFLREGDSPPHMLSVVLPQGFKHSSCLLPQLFNFSFTSHCFMERETWWPLTFCCLVAINKVGVIHPYLHYEAFWFVFSVTECFLLDEFPQQTALFCFNICKISTIHFLTNQDKLPLEGTDHLHAHKRTLQEKGKTQKV